MCAPPRQKLQPTAYLRCPATMCDDSFDWLGILQVVAVTLALLFTAHELRSTARERKKLEARLRHERLEGLLISIVDTESWIEVWNAPAIRRSLRGLEARLAGVLRGDHEQAWLLAGMKNDVDAGGRKKLVELVDRAEAETLEAIRALWHERAALDGSGWDKARQRLRTRW